MKTNRHTILKVFFTVLLLCTVLTTAVCAAFSDVQDADTAQALELLQSLGIAEGYPDGGFHPDEYLTRAQFCKFAVLMMDAEDHLLSASQKTLFMDVTSSHWAAAYVNLAYSQSLIQGYGNGMFGPDDSITYEQAVTISLRILGYGSADIGTVYPDDYLRFADSIGLTDALDRKPGDAITRGEAAKLLYTLLRTPVKSGSLYVSKLASRTVSSLILLDERTTSPTGMMNCAKFYSGGQAVWYPLAAELDASLIGSEGTVLLNGNNAVIGFLPDDTVYTVVEGVLLSNNYRDSYASGSSVYYVKMHTGNGVELYPRANTISANLVGSSGTLLLNENHYAAAFLADDSSVYNLTDAAVLLDNNAVSSDGVSGCAEFLIGGKSVFFTQNGSCSLPDAMLGASGTVMYDGDNAVIDFLADGTKYTVLSGIYLETTSSGVSFLVNGTSQVYASSVSFSSSQAGTYGRILLNAQNRISAFAADSSRKYTLVSGAVLLNSYVLSDTVYNTYGARFFVNGKTAWYPYSTYDCSIGSIGSYPADIWYQYIYGLTLNQNAGSAIGANVGSEGTLLLDSSGGIVDFIPDGTFYYLVSGIFLNANSSLNGRSGYVTFYLNGQTIQYAKSSSASVASASVGSYGTLLLNMQGAVTAFAAEDSSGFSLTQTGVLISAGQIADDGETVLAKMYADGRTATYALSGTVSASDVGRSGRLLLDGTGRAAAFIPEDAVNTHSVTVQQCTASQLAAAARTYTVSSSLPVILADGTVTKWSEAYTAIPAGADAQLYFDNIGSLYLILIR